MHKSVIVSILASVALAAHNTPALFRRQGVELPCSASGEKDCGTGCIPLSYTCCPDQQGGCSAAEVCWLGSNGVYGCCPLGETCEGPGGVETQPGGTITSTQTETEPTISTSMQTSTSSTPPVETESTTSSSIPLSTPPTTFTSQTPAQSTTSFSTESAPPSEGTTSTPVTLPSKTASASASATASHVVTAGAVANFRSGGLLQLFGALMAGVMMA